MRLSTLLLPLACALLWFSAANALDAQSSTTWPMYNNSLSGQRFSHLKLIDTETVDTLHEVCRVQVASGGSFQAGLVMMDGTLYATAEQETVAVDARDCTVSWRQTHVPEGDALFRMNRGVAMFGGKLYRGTSDGHLLAIDAKTGAVQWDDTVGDWVPGEAVTGAPLAWNGLIFIGLGGGDAGIKGRIMAFDALSGREVWRFNTIPTGKEVGAATWKLPPSAERGGGGSWTSFALDPKTAELFIPVGNPAPDLSPNYRPGDNLFTNSILVLDARSGALKWWLQVAPADALDYDLSAGPMLFRNSEEKDMVAAAGKDGFLRVVDRATHTLRFKTPVTTIENADKKPNSEGVHVCPGALGGVEWNGPAYDASRKSIYIGAVDWCSTYKATPQEYKSGRIYFAGSFKFDPQPSGWVTALDADTGAVKWRYHAEAPVLAGVTPTAGGIVLTGDYSGNLLALDSNSGKLLKKIATGGALAGGVITYDLGGRQYVALTSGNISRTGFGTVGLPSIVIMTTEPAAGAGTPFGDAQHGRTLYAQNCVSCHGLDGMAVNGHNLQAVTREHAIETLKAPKSPMPAMYPSLLHDQDLRDISVYLETLKGRVH